MSNILRDLAATAEAIVADRKCDDSLYRRIDRIERDARALIADGFDAESVALILLGTSRIRDTAAYRESADAHSAAVERRHKWESERRETFNEAVRLGHEALAAKSRKYGTVNGERIDA